MDPNLFYIDWARVFEVLPVIVILAFILERVFALLFESRFFHKTWSRQESERTHRLCFGCPDMFVLGL